MTNFKAPPKLSRRILMLTTSVFLLAATDGALAKGGGNSGGDHSSDHGGMKTSDPSHQSAKQDALKIRESGHDHTGQVSQKPADKDHDAEKHAEKHKDKDHDADKHAEKHKDKDKDKKPGTTTVSNNPPAPGAGGTTTVHPNPNPLPVGLGSSGQVGITPAPGSIHPIQGAPVASNPPSSGNSTKSSGSITITTGDLKTAGRVAVDAAVVPVVAGVVLSGVADVAIVGTGIIGGIAGGHPVEATKEFLKDAGKEALDLLGF